MSYSRPGTRQVNALVEAPKPVSTRIVGGNDSVRVNPNGRFIDNTNPSQVGRNAAQGFEQMASFLESFGQVAQPVGESIVMSNANREVGELLQTHPNIGKLYGESDPDTRALINSLNPITKDLFIRAHYAKSSNEYKTILTTAALADSRLTTAAAKSDPDGFASAWADVRQKAMDSSGLSGLPSSVLGAVSGELGQIDGAVRGALAKAQFADQKQINLTTLGQGLVAEIETTGRGLARINADPNSTPEQSKQAVATAQATLAEQVKTKSAGGVATPQEQLRSLVGQTGARVQELVLLGRFDDAEDLLDTLKVLSLGEIKIGPEGKLNFWDQPIPAGKDKTTTIAGWINTQRASLDKVKTAFAAAKGRRAVLDLVKRAAKGDPTARAELEGRFDEMGPDELEAAITLFSKGESFGDQLGPEDLELVEMVGDPNRDRTSVAETIKSRIRNGTLSMGKGLQLLRSNQTGADVDGPTSSTLTALSGAQRSGIAEERAIEIRALEDTNTVNGGFALQGTVDQRTRATQREIEVAAFNKTRDQVRAAAADGKPMSQADINAAYEENLKNEADRRMKAASDGSVPSSLNVAQIVTGELNEVRGLILSGKRGVDIFPDSLKALATQRGLSITGSRGFRNLQDLLISRMQQARDASGSPEWAKPGPALQQMVRDAEQERERTGGAPVNSGRGFYESNTGANAKPGGSLTRPSDRSGGDEQGPQALILNGLGTVAGVLLGGGSASAQEAEPSEVVNPEQLELLATMWTGKSKPTLQTPGLPQVAATAEVQAVPTAINSDRHPFFVAIGIAEGTRTPDGGYTQAYYGHRDPGDGNNNRGTVSGGRNNALSPKQVDRKWMASLSGTAVKVSGYLKQAGLKPGTQGWNRVMFNVLDLRVQAPAAVQTFLGLIPKVGSQGFSVEAIAKARADSFYESSGRLNAPGFGNNYQRLFADQRSRAGVWDYRRRF